VRFLFTFVGGVGHFAPQLPIASALAAAGHAVAFSTFAPMVGDVEARGFTAFATQRAGGFAPAEKKPLLEPSTEREERVLRETFAGWAARERAGSVLAHAEAWRPDMLVCDEVDYGGALAAERLGLPCATVLINGAGSLLRPDLVAEPLAALRAEHGLGPDTDPSRDLVLSPFPPSFRDPRFPLPPTAHSLRPCGTGRGSPDGAIYFTLGTVFNLESGDLFTRVLAGLRGREVIVTVGSQIDPEELGPQPPEVRVERFVPQAEVLPRCRAVVSHGGSGSVMGALAYGLPSVLIPLGADQMVNADRGAALGVARVLDAVRATPEDVREAVAAVLEDARYRHAAERLRDEIAGLPGPEHAVGLLEALG
jgi:UDP:flavonoid glycosyltransferase YjiC (YdhE family)